MKKEIYESIIKNSKIAYLKINFKKNKKNEYIGINVIEQSKEFKNVFQVISKNNILNKDITESIINNWIESNFTKVELEKSIKEIIEKGHKEIEFTTKLSNKHVKIDIYYLENYFILVCNINYDFISDDKKINIFRWTKDLNGVYTDFDFKSENKKNIVGKKDTDLWKNDEVKQYRENEKEVINNRVVKTFYETLVSQNGNKIYLESTIWPLVDNDNKVIGTRGYSIRINDKLALEKNIEQNEENFREITKYSDSVFIIRDKKRATYVSPAFRNVFGDEANNLYEDINYLDKYFKRVNINSSILECNFNELNEGTSKIKLYNGQEKWIWYKFLPIKGINGDVTKRVGILTDVTEKKIIEEEKEQLKLDFFTNISHELRTPINLILSSIQLINLNLKKLSQEDKDKLSKYIDIVEVNGLRLIKLVNNLLDSTKIDSGFIKFTPINSDIISFIEGVCDSVVEYAQLNKMNLIFDTESEEEIVLFDPDIIERVLLNLLSNAVKFNKINGNIYVNIYTNNENIIISIKDEGIGIPDEKIESIFDRFEQAGHKNRQEKQGTGIGLYLVKSLIDLHGGSIEVKSKLNKGSEFIVTIPKKVLNNSEELDIKDEEIRYRRINIEFSDV